MAQRTLKSIGLTANSIVFADPTDVGNTTKFTVDVVNLNLPNKTSTKVVRSEVLSNRIVAVKKPGCDDCSSADAALSVRIKVTSLPNVPVSQQMIDDAFENAKRAYAVGLLNGFKPSTSDLFIIDSGL